MRLQPAANQSQQTQYASLPLPTSSNYLEPQRNMRNDCVMEPPSSMIESDRNGIATIATVNMTESAASATAMACNYKNCTIAGSFNCNRSVRRNDIVFQTPQHTRVKRDPELSNPFGPSRNQFNRPSHRAEINICRSSEAEKETANDILPPPLFDETAIVSNALPLLPNDSIRQIKSRRHHRTIPRHFTVSATPVNANTEQTLSLSNSGLSAKDKKSICQCPVQHVPKTYMASNHLNLNQNNDMLLSNITKNVAKSASFTSSPTSAHTPGYQRNSASGLLNATPSTSRSQSMSSAQSSSLQLPKTPVKIPTISKQIGNNEFDAIIPAMVTPIVVDVKDVASSNNNVAMSKIELMPDEIKSTPIVANSDMFASSPFSFLIE